MEITWGFIIIIAAIATGIMLVLAAPISTDPIKPLFEKLLELDKSEFEGFSGYLFESWL